MRLGKLPNRLDITDLDAAAIGDFLQHLENDRGNSTASRNTRRAAIHSLFGYASLQAPEHAQLISRVLAIQAKRATAQTGLRVSELTTLTVSDLRLGTGAHVSCHGKGRKDRCTPLMTHTQAVRIGPEPGLELAHRPRVVHAGARIHDPKLLRLDG